MSGTGVMESGTMKALNLNGKEAWLDGMERVGGERGFYINIASIVERSGDGIPPQPDGVYSIMKKGDSIHATAGDVEYSWKVKL